MTSIDAILLLTCGIALARWPICTPWALLAVVIAAGAAIRLEGLRKPLLPAYAVAAGVLAAALLPPGRLPPWLLSLGLGGASALLAASFAGCLILPLRRYPPTAGKLPVGTFAIPPELIERFPPPAGRGLDGPAPAARLWYPAAPPAPQSWLRRLFDPSDRQAAIEGAAPVATPRAFPIVLYFGGWPGTAVQNLVLIRELASRGFVVVSMIYPSRLPSMSDAQFAGHVAQFDAPYDFNTEDGARRTIRSFEERVLRGAEDAVAMLEMLSAVNHTDALPQFRGRLNVERAGVLGFSMGGGTAAQAGWLEPRFKAVVNMDGRHWNEALHDGVSRPYLYISEILDMPTERHLASMNLDTRYNAELDRIDYSNVARNLERHGGLQVTLTGMNHMNFTDENLRSPWRRYNHGGPIDRFRALHIVNTYVASFFERELKGTAQPLLDGDSSQFPEAKVIVWLPPADAPRQLR